MIDISYRVRAEWPARAETVNGIAARLIQTMAGLRQIQPGLDGWQWGRSPEDADPSDDIDYAPFETVSARIDQEIAANVGADECGTADPRLGYLIHAARNATADFGAMTIDIRAGIEPADRTQFLRNRFQFDMACLEPGLNAYELLRAIMLSLADTWDAERADAVVPLDSGSRRSIGLIWMSYLEPAAAAACVPPPVAVVECRNRGGLFLAATEERFAAANPAHVKAALAIETALLACKQLRGTRRNEP